ncbi:MAG: hypothetical protein QUT30_08040 [Acidobacteriota bacterium]|nr:hypothetical protein [Acidobacteriota bacterium]
MRPKKPAAINRPLKSPPKTSRQNPSINRTTARLGRKDDGSPFLLIVLLAVCAVVFVIASPGIVLNMMSGRFEGHPDGLLKASVRDIQTWLFSIFFWACVVLIIYRSFKNKPVFIYLLIFLATTAGVFIFYSSMTRWNSLKAADHNSLISNPGNPVPNSAASTSTIPDTDSQGVHKAAEPDSSITEIPIQIQDDAEVAEIAVQEAKASQELAFPVRHKHTIGGCEGTITFFPDEIRFQSKSHSFSFAIEEVNP